MAEKLVAFAKEHGASDDVAGAHIPDLKAIMALLAQHGG